MPPRTITAINNRASYSLTRDQATYDYLQQIGCDHARVGGCPTIFLDRMVDRLPILSERDKADVLISVRNPTLMSIPLRKQSQVRDDVQGIIHFLRQEGYQDIRLLCHDHRDIPFAASFPEVDYVYTGDVYYYLSLLRSCKLSIGYRLHAALPCMSFGVPAIKISYDERALSLMQTVGLADWNIDMITSSDNVLEQVVDRYRRLDTLQSLRQQIQPTWDALYDIAAQTFTSFATDVLNCRDQTSG
jgi:polysaccharide pyruvyl transferase WcaK-like protein